MCTRDIQYGGVHGWTYFNSRPIDLEVIGLAPNCPDQQIVKTSCCIWDWGLRLSVVTIVSTKSYLNPGGGGGVLSGKVGTGMCGPDRVPFRLLRFTNAPPFLFANWFRLRSLFCKMLNFRRIFPVVYL